jgi:hypothetical protein
MRYFRLLKSFFAVAALSLAAVHAYADKPAVIRIGVAQQGNGDPPTFGGSPAATVQLQQSPTASRSNGCSSREPVRRSTKRSPTTRSTSPIRATCPRYSAAPTV